MADTLLQPTKLMAELNTKNDAVLSALIKSRVCLRESRPLHHVVLMRQMAADVTWFPGA